MIGSRDLLIGNSSLTGLFLKSIEKRTNDKKEVCFVEKLERDVQRAILYSCGLR